MTSGRFLFAVNTGSTSISRYGIAADGSPALLGSTPLGGDASKPVDARLAPDGGTLWVVDTGSATVSGLTVAGGSLRRIAVVADAAARRSDGLRDRCRLARERSERS